MDKNNSVAVGKTPCDVCGAPSTIAIGSKLFCNQHRPAAGEKRASDEAPGFKNAADQLVDIHLPKR